MANVTGGWPTWLSQHRTSLPGPVVGHLERPALAQRCMPTERYITALKAPGGFGKTTLLAACCRTLHEKGIPTAWLTLDGKDESSALETYLVYAFHRAGLAVLESLKPEDVGRLPASSSIEVLQRALSTQRGPWVLALDEVELVSNPESVGLLNSLMGSRLPNLHVALACRELPAGLNIAPPLFRGEVDVLTEEDLRFSRQDIKRFFKGSLSRRELASIASNSSGWPIALRIHRNAGGRHGRANNRFVRDAVHNWLEFRLLSRIAVGDRDLLLDMGLLDWMDSELVDEVLAGVGLMQRVADMSAMAGLLEPVRGSSGNVWRLHPLIREYCSERRRRETPERYRSIHRQIAAALAKRGEAIRAMRHASEAEDASLVGRILSDAGGIWLMLRENHHRLVAADRFLTSETLAMYPRLKLVRAVAQIVKGQLGAARRTLGVDEVETLTWQKEDIGAQAEWCLARSILAQNACESIGAKSVRALISEINRIVESPNVGPPMRAIMEYALCQVYNLKAEFSAALDRAKRAQDWLGVGSSSFPLLLALQQGQVAMAQGRVHDANAFYRGALDNATQAFLNDPRLVILGTVLTKELDLERNRIAAGDRSAQVPREFWQKGLQFASYAAATAVATELTLMDQGAEEALALVNQMVNHAHEAQLTSLVRYLAGLRVTLLLAADQVGAAERGWDADSLPHDSSGCLDLEHQSWREMELLACARVRLLCARGDHADGRTLLRDLLMVASLRGLRRTAMRALAIGVALEESSGNRIAAIQHLTEYLILFEKSDYARAIVREGTVVVPVLNAFLESHRESPHWTSAEELLSDTTVSQPVEVPQLTDRESEILKRLDTETDRQIGARLGISHDGVRYHIRGLFAKLTVHSRLDAVHRARLLGLLQSDSEHKSIVLQENDRRLP